MEKTPDDPSSIDFKDDLTGLPNRRFLHRHIEFGIPWTTTGARPPVSFILFDFDEFRHVNELAGDAAGDAFLVGFTELAKPMVGSGVLGRYGGDSFLAIVPGASKDEALKIFERFKGLAASMSPPLTVSAGIVTYPDDVVAPAPLIDLILKTILVAKQAGGDQAAAAGRVDAKVQTQRDLHSTIPCPQFVSREDELRIAMVLLDHLRRGRPGFLWVHGTPGIGKSRLLQEIRKRVHVVKVGCLASTCSESHRDVPAHPLVQLIGQYYEANPGAMAALRPKFNAIQQSMLSALIPAFASWREPGETQSPTDRVFLIAETVRDTLCAMAADRPLLLQIDNADHVDQTTIDILAAATGERKAPLGVLMAAEGDLPSLDPARAAAIQKLVQGLPSTLNPKTAALAPLPPKAIATMLAAILPDAVMPDGFREAITQASGGNPQYVEEVVRKQMLARKIQKSKSGWTLAPVGGEDLPPALDDLIKRVAAALPKDAHETLSHAAVLDWPFELQVLQEVMGQHKPRILDELDRLRAVGLIRAVANTNREEFEFTAGHTRTVLTRAFDPESKKRAHRRIVNILKLRSLDQNAKGGPEIEFHMALATDPPALMPAAASADAPVPAPDSAHLTPTGVKRAMEFLRLFTGLLAMRRLYPQWEQAGENLRTALGSTIAGLFEAVPSIVFGIRSGALTVNETGLETDPMGELGRPVMNVFDTRFISTLSLHRGLELREIDALAAGLSRPIEKAGISPTHWENFLQGEELQHVEIFQAATRAPGQETVRLRRAQMTVERPLTDDEAALFWNVVETLISGVDNLRQFGPGSPVVEETLDQVVEAFEILLLKNAMLAMSATGDQLIVNGQPLVPAIDRDYASMAFLTSQLQGKNIQRITLMDGLGGDETRMLASLLSVEDPSNISFILEANEAPHVVIAVLEKPVESSEMAMPETQDGSMFGDFEPIPLQPIDTAPQKPMMVRIDMRARTMILSPVDVFLSERIAKEFTPTIEILHFGRLHEQAYELIDRLCSFFIESDPEWRKRALLLVNRTLTEANDSRSLIFERIREPLLKCLRAEQEAGAQKILGETVRLWASMALALGELSQLAGFIAEGVKIRLESKNTSRDFKTLLQSKLQTLSSVTPHPALEALKGGADANRLPAVQILQMMGNAMIVPLITLIRTTESLDIRTHAAHALRGIGANAQADLVGKVRPDTDADQARRVLEVLDQAGTGSFSSAIIAALDHKSSAVHQAAFRLVKRMDAPVAVAVLRKLIASPNPATVLATFAAARGMKIADLSPDAGKLATEGENEELIRAACDYLGAFPSPASLPALRRVFEQKGKAFGLVKGLSDQTRAVAVLAAKRIDHPEARQLVKDAAEDKSEIVRRVVNAAPSR